MPIARRWGSSCLPLRPRPPLGESRIRPWCKAAFGYGGAILVTLLVLAWRSSSTPTRMERIVMIPPGIHVIHVHTDAQRLEASSDPRRLYFRVENMRLSEVDAGARQGL